MSENIWKTEKKREISSTNLYHPSKVTIFCAFSFCYFILRALKYISLNTIYALYNSVSTFVEKKKKKIPLIFFLIFFVLSTTAFYCSALNNLV